MDVIKAGRLTEVHTVLYMIIPLQLSFNPSSGGWFAACVVGVCFHGMRLSCAGLYCHLELSTSFPHLWVHHRTGAALCSCPLKTSASDERRGISLSYMYVLVPEGLPAYATQGEKKLLSLLFPPPFLSPLLYLLSGMEISHNAGAHQLLQALQRGSVSHSFQKARLSRRAHWCKTQHCSRAAGGGRISPLQVPSFSGSVAGAAACAERMTMFRPVIMGGIFLFYFLFKQNLDMLSTIDVMTVCLIAKVTQVVLKRLQIIRMKIVKT